VELFEERILMYDIRVISMRNRGKTTKGIVITVGVTERFL
jgi:hypothetical protein